MSGRSTAFKQAPGTTVEGTVRVGGRRVRVRRFWSGGHASVCTVLTANLSEDDTRKAMMEAHRGRIRVDTERPS